MTTNMQPVTFTTSSATPQPEQRAHTKASRATDFEEFKKAALIEEIDLTELDKRRIDPLNQPTKPIPIISLAGQQISTSGNLTAICAQAKAGKTGVVTAILGAVIAEHKGGIILGQQQRDFLGFTAAPHCGGAVIVFDTEQSPYDAWSLIDRSMKRAGIATLPPNFRCYSLADVAVPQRRAFLAAEMKRGGEECDGVYATIIDGVADLCTDLNDTAEAFGLVDDLTQLAIKHACPVIAVLHENPSGTGQAYSKGRGHLGSQLERKAESNLRIEKKDDISTIYSDRCRRASLPKAQGVKFKWDDETSMHVLFSETSQQDKTRDAEKERLADVFEGVTEPIKWGELKKRIADVLAISPKTAEGKIKSWTQLGLINKSANHYVCCYPQPSITLK